MLSVLENDLRIPVPAMALLYRMGIGLVDWSNSVADLGDQREEGPSTGLRGLRVDAQYLNRCARDVHCELESCMMVSAGVQFGMRRNTHAHQPAGVR